MKLLLFNLVVCDMLRLEINWFIYIVCVLVMVFVFVVGY